VNMGNFSNVNIRTQVLCILQTDIEKQIQMVLKIFARRNITYKICTKAQNPYIRQITHYL
jgi:hypothetical protein